MYPETQGRENRLDNLNIILIRKESKTGADNNTWNEMYRRQIEVAGQQSWV